MGSDALSDPSLRSRFHESLHSLLSPDRNRKYWLRSKSAEEVVKVALKDSSPNVRIAAARAAAKFGLTEKAISVLGS